MSHLFESLPAAVLDQISRNVAARERVLMRLSNDLNVGPDSGDRWLIVTDQRVLIYSGDAIKSVEILLKDVDSAKVEGLVGGGRLVLQNHGRELRLINFTNSRLSQFTEVAAGIEQLIHTGEVTLPTTIDRIRCSSCKRLLPEKNGICPKCIDRWTTLRRLLKYFVPYRSAVMILCAIFLLSTVAEVIAPLTIRYLMDHIMRPGLVFSLLASLIGILLIARLLMWFCETARAKVSVWLGARATADIRKTLFERIIHLPMRSFDEWSVGTLISRLVNDVDRLEEFMGSGAPLLMMSVLLLCAILGLLLYLSPILTAGILFPIPLIVLWTWFVWKNLRNAQDRQSSCLARLTTHISECLNGIRVVKVFCQEEEEYKRFLYRNDHLRKASGTAEQWSLLFFTAISFLMNIGVFLIWYIGGMEVLSGALTLGSLLAAGSFAWMLYWPLQWFGQVSNSLSQAMTGAVRFFELVDSPAEEPLDGSGLPVRCIKGVVWFRNVTFGYAPGRPVLSELNFKAEPGEVIGIIGRTGTGKTTLMNLLCRFYEVDRGTILVDGVDVRNYRLDDLRKQVAIVPQDMFLFNGTIEANIRYGRPQATLQEVMSAARMANAHKFILEKSDGYDSQVGPRGERLSGGERQRIAIARAILANPRILILDEATSSLDVESEAAVQKALACVSESRTTFIIAHRLSTIRNADRVIVLDRGRIAETGTLDQLFASKGLLWEFANAYSEMRHF